MEGELWKGVYALIVELGKHYRRVKVQFTETAILEVYFWAALHDRPTSWACRQKNWPVQERYWPKPSPATMSRRLRGVMLLTFMVALNWSLRQRCPSGMLKTLDAKPLTVGGFSKDRDAKMGWAAGHKARGYKIFGICDATRPGAIDTWTLGPMNQSEPVTAGGLIQQVTGGGYLLGDSLYDTNPLHEQVHQRGWQLLAPRKKPQANLGHRLHSPIACARWICWNVPLAKRFILAVQASSVSLPTWATSAGACSRCPVGCGPPTVWLYGFKPRLSSTSSGLLKNQQLRRRCKMLPCGRGWPVLRPGEG